MSPRSLLSRTTRRLVAATAVLALGMSAVASNVPVEAQTDSEAARQTAREIQAQAGTQARETISEMSRLIEAAEQAQPH